MKYDSIIEKITDIILKKKNIKDINSIDNILLDWNKSLSNICPNTSIKDCIKDLNIVIVNVPCNGFGDIIYSMKLANYLKEWYNINVKIASTKSKQFITLGYSQDDLIDIKYNKKSECRRLSNMKLKDKTIYDLIFVAPFVEYSPLYSDVKKMIPYSNEYNTYFFSEYNGYDTQLFDFPTGVGRNLYGLFFTDQKIGNRLPNLENPYALIYISDNITNFKKCYSSFIQMIIYKYNSKYKNLDIVLPNWIIEDKSFKKNIITLNNNKYNIINIISKNNIDKIIISETKDNQSTLNIRADILPVSYLNMLSLIKHSIKDILVTGDQSVTDVLSCCGSKNIFYQIAPWKETFSKRLATHLPNKYLLRKKTSCGTLDAIKYNSDYKKFITKWDFRKLAKPKMDSIILAAEIRKNQTISNIETIIKKSRSIKILKNKIKKTYNK
jgi:hypothetical protein